MTKDEVIAQGWEILFSVPSVSPYWGKWMVEIKLGRERLVAGYGETEELAFDDAWKTVQQKIQ